MTSELAPGVLQDLRERQSLFGQPALQRARADAEIARDVCELGAPSGLQALDGALRTVRELDVTAFRQFCNFMARGMA